MRTKLGPAIAGIAAGVVGFATVLTLPTAHAATSPIWEPDPNAVGTINFYNSSGHQIIGGLISDLPFSAYAVGSTLPRAGDTKALLEYAQPDPNHSDPADWQVATISAQATTFPVTGIGVPSSISSLDASHPVVTESATDNTLEQDILALPNTGPAGDSFDGASGCAYETVANNPSTCTNADYQNLYQIRLLTSNNSGNASGYDDADLLVDPTTGAWSQVYPAPPPPSVTTTTTLTTDPTTSTTQGTSVTLTATIVASDASSPAGTVQFMDGSKSLGSPIAVDTSTETAEVSSSSLPPGQDSFTAVFVASDPVTYGGSTSDPTVLLINPVAAKPKITGKTQVGKTVSCDEATSHGEASSFVWQLNAKTRSSARTYTLPSAALGKSLTCVATLTVTGGTPSSATSAAKKVARGAALKARKRPRISGADEVGRTEKVNHGKWSPRASSFSYQWLLNGRPIKHATRLSYKLIKADSAKKISCRVTAKRTAYARGTATTKSLKVKS